MRLGRQRGNLLHYHLFINIFNKTEAAFFLYNLILKKWFNTLILETQFLPVVFPGTSAASFSLISY